MDNREHSKVPYFLQRSLYFLSIIVPNILFNRDYNTDSIQWNIHTSHKRKMSNNGVQNIGAKSCSTFVNGSVVSNAKMGIVCGTRKSRKLAGANGTIHGVDCECAMSQTLSHPLTKSQMTSQMNSLSKNQAWRIWGYTPWRNGYHEFKQDIMAKCSRFMTSYVYWSSDNNNQDLCKYL